MSADKIPGLKRLPKANGFATWYWSARQIARDVGDFEPKTMRLWHGRGEPSMDELSDIRRAANNLTLDLKDWRVGRDRRRQRSTRMRGVVYFIRAGESVKIGFSKHAGTRMRQLQRSSPVGLELLLEVAGSPVLERELHQRFMASRTHDEWFRLDGAVARFIARQKTGENMSEPLCQNQSTDVRIAKNLGVKSRG